MPHNQNAVKQGLLRDSLFVVPRPRIKFNSLSEIKQQARNYFRRL